MRPLTMPRAITVAETAHHTEIEPDNRTATYANVAGVGVSVEESILDDLLCVVLAEPSTDLRDVDTHCVQGIGLIKWDTVDVLHDENVLGGEVAQDARAGDEGIVAVQMRKLLDVSRLDEKVHLLLCNVPHFIHQRAEIDDIVAADKSDDGRGTLHERKVHAHDLVDAGALHLDDDLFSRSQHRPVCLGDTCRAKRRTVDLVKDPIPIALILLFDNGKNDREGEGARAGLQLHQLVAVLRRQKVGAHAHDLSELNKSWTKILKDGPQLCRRQSVYDVVAAQDGNHFA